jgi:BirA family biotin operon repressor/biotin-[acetyl-CoA-carboxylase] ligase
VTLDEKLLTILYRSKDISLQSISEQLDLSESVILESIQVLQSLGYAIESSPQNQLQLLESPDLLIADDLKARIALKTKEQLIGNKILVFENTASTNDVIERFGVNHHPEGLVIFAEAQTEGRGRHGRAWFSPPKRGLWFSILLRPKIDLASAPRLTILASVAVATALGRITGLEFQLKWPNDILCRKKKVAGILVELNADSKGIHHAVIGIGINVNLEKNDFPKELLSLATSLQIEGNKTFHRPDLAVEILEELERHYSIIENDEFSYILDHWLKLDCTLGEQISVLWSDGRRLKGLASNLDPDGALLIRTDEGMIERITAGEITLEKLRTDG